MRMAWLALLASVLMGCTMATNDGTPEDEADPNGNGSGNGNGTGMSALRQVAEEYPTVPAQRTKETLDRLTVRDHWIMESVHDGKLFKLAVFLKACQADPNIRWHRLIDGRPYDCISGQQDWNETIQLKATYGLGPIEDDVEMGRQEVIIYEKCKSGEIDEGSCRLYFSIQQQVDQGTAQTSEVIVDNIGNKCRVGRDPGCYP